MSETPQRPPDLFNPGAPPPGEEQDVLFRVQMTVANFVLGYWRHGLAILAVGLAGLFVFSMWKTHVRDAQREVQAKLARIDADLPAPSQLAMMGIGPLDDPADAERMAALATAAKAYEEAAQQVGSPSATMAWVRAAQTWERAGKADEARKAWENAKNSGGKGPLEAVGVVGLAHQKARAGDVDGAVADLRAVQGEGFEAQWALYQAGLIYEGAGRKEDARKVFDEFRTRFATSVLADQVAAAQGRLVEAG